MEDICHSERVYVRDRQVKNMLLFIQTKGYVTFLSHQRKVTKRTCRGKFRIASPEPPTRDGTKGGHPPFWISPVGGGGEKEALTLLSFS